MNYKCIRELSEKGFPVALEPQQMLQMLNKVEATEKLRTIADIIQADYFEWHDVEHDGELEIDIALHQRMLKLRDAVKVAE